METLDLSELFTTKSQADDFASRLALITQKIFETGFNPEAALLEHFGIQKKDTFMTLLRTNHINSESRIAIKQFIEKIQERISTLSVISLVLAFEPNEIVLQSLSRWFIVNTSRQVLFDIKVDTNLIAGAAILSNGKYLDFSIKPHFDRIFQEVLTPKLVAPSVKS